MPTHTQPSHNDDDMPAEIDFSNGIRGKFYHPNAIIKLPLYLEQDIQKALLEHATKRGIDMNQLVNELLEKDIELIQAAG